MKKTTHNLNQKPYIKLSYHDKTIEIVIYCVAFFPLFLLVFFIFLNSYC